MTEALSSNEIKTRSLVGVKWLMITNVASILAAFLTTFLLARISPETLGAYGLAQIFVSVITTFAVFGGQVVLRNFIPKVTDQQKRGKLLFSYGLIVMGAMIAVLTLFWLFPEWLEFLLRQKFDMRHFLFFGVAAVAIVTLEVMVGAVAGLMQIKRAAIARSLPQYILMPIIVGLYFFWRQPLRDYPLQLILGVFLLAYLCSIGVCAAGLWRDNRFRVSAGWYLPPRFMNFCWTTHLATLFSFVYLQFDRIMVLQHGNLADLGKYQVIISLVLVIEYVPSVLQTAIVPMLSTVLAAGREEAIKRAFLLIYRNCVLLMSLISFPIIGFSSEILRIFGAEYANYYYVLCLFAATSVLRSSSTATIPILTALEKNTFRMVVSFVQISIQIAGTLLFLDRFGILAIVVAKITGVLLASLTNNLYVVYGLKMSPRLPRSFKAGSSIAVAAVAIRILVLPEGWVWMTMLTVLCITTFVILSRLTVQEIRNVADALIRGKSKRLMDGIAAET